MQLTQRIARTYAVTRKARRVLLLVCGLFTPLSFAAPFTTPAELNVNDQGAATYSVPLRTPPGTAGMQPALSLQYNSQSGNGLLGMGWSLGGLSVIHRCPTTVAQDGVKGGINYDANDKYCLDGQRLIAINGAYGASGTEYRTERESFTKVISYGTQGNGPQTFKAWTKSGQVLEFGNTADSAIEAQGKTTIRLWAINKIEDRVGNYLTVSYTEDNPNGQYYPIRIDYTGNANTGLMPYNSVQFTYETRSDVTPVYQGAGPLIKNTVRLSKLQTLSNTTLVKEYRLQYGQSPSTIRSRLQSITECDGDNTCLAPTSVAWADGGGGLTGSFSATRVTPDNWAYLYTAHPGDFNGDGISDIWMTGGNGSFFCAGPGIASSNNCAQVHLGDWRSQYQIHTGDFNGDGITDIWMTGGNGSFFCAGPGIASSNNCAQVHLGDWRSQYQIHTGDFNGDGITDIWMTGGNGNFFCAGPGIAKGNNCVQTDTNNWGSQYQIYTGDFNGDGKTDIWMTGGNGSFFCKGPGIATANNCVQMDATDWRSYAIYPGDFSGNGSTDIFLFGASGVFFAPGGTNPDLLTTVTNGLGVTTTLNYKPITDNSVYTKDTTAAYPQVDVQAPLYVVSSVTTSDGVGGTRSMSYTYGGAKSQLDGRGFLGFRWKQMVDQSTGLKSTTWFNQNFPYTGLPSVTEKRTASGMLLSRTENTWGSFTPTGVATGSPVMFPALTRSVELSYDLASGGSVQGALLASVTSDSQYDANGNPISIQVSTQEGASTWTKLTTNTYSDTVSAWLLGRLTRASVASTLPNGTSATRSSSFSYDLTNGLLLSETIEPDSTTLKLTTTYIYDLFGNKVSSTVSGPDIVSRTSSTTYDTQGRFPVQSTNALGHSETRVFDPRFGAITSLTGPNGLTTTWSYDGFGRKLTETRADTTTTTTSYTLCGGGVTCPTVGSAGAGAASIIPSYFVTTSSTGSAPVTGYFDQLNREIRSTTLGFDGAPVYKDTLYDTLGRVAQTSKPYRSGSPQYASVTYDLLNRPLVQTAYDGSTTTLSYAGYTTSSTNALNQINTRVQNSQGQLVNSTDALNGAVAYSYDPFGNLTQTVDSAANVTTLSYDLRGRKTAMTDPDMGHWTYTYNALGELVAQTDAKGQTATMAYDKLGRMVSRTEPEGTSTWAYDGTTYGVGKLAFVTAPNGYLRTHSYDVFGRPSNISTTLAGQRYYVDTGYDTAGRLETVLYHTGFAVRYSYTAQGYLSEVRNSLSNALYWQAQAEDAQGRVTQALLGNGLTTVRGYDVMGRTTSISTGVGAGSNVQFLSYSYDTLGNLTQRSDANQNLTETFAYDSLNRLTQNSVSGVGTLSYQYDSLGNITTKSDVGSYLYGSPGITPGQPGYAGPHAVTAISAVAGGGAGGSYSYDLNGNQISGGGRSLSYTSFNLPSVIQKGSEIQSFQYDPERVRTLQTTATGTTVYLNPRLDLGPAHYEEEIRGSLIIRKHYINAGAETVALYTEKSDGTSQTSYLHHDHLGSLDTVTNEAGSIIERLSYDAWGKRRQVNGSADPLNLLRGLTTTRGFTNHEHLDGVGLIHMNGRVYDPTLGRFLSADPHIQAPTNLQSYNRYSYVMNNPLSYTDPSGYFSFKSFFRTVAAIAVNFIPGINVVAAGFLSGVISGGDLKSGIIGAITAGAFNIVGGTTGLGGEGSLGKILAHGVVGGTSSVLQGGKFGEGFLAAGFTQAFAPKISTINPGVVGPDIGRTIVAAIVGGTAAVLGGGKFENGAVTGAFSRLFNDEAVHRKTRPHDGLIVERGPGVADGRFSPTGEFRRYGDGSPRPHLGVDIAGDVGDPIVAAASGKVSVCQASQCTSSGNQVNISHSDGTTTRYFHLDSISASQGASVTVGSSIGTLGTTGNATGTLQPHLHFEVRQGGSTGTPLDPEAWLNR